MRILPDILNLSDMFFRLRENSYQGDMKFKSLLTNLNLFHMLRSAPVNLYRGAEFRSSDISYRLDNVNTYKGLTFN